MSVSIQHIAIIMDGNRRWAQQKNLAVFQGHIQGVQSVKITVRYCVEHHISYLTLFAFSTENWKRSTGEVGSLSHLLTVSIRKYADFILSNKIRLHILGDLSPFPKELKKAFDEMCEKTKNNQGLNFILAINYGGRKEILNAVKQIYLTGQKKNDNQDVFENHINSMTEQDFEQYLQSNVFPPPDLMIRTGGVRRLSNFYLWSSAYSELYFSDVMWPEFNVQELEKAIMYYSSMKRRFGGDG